MLIFLNRECLKSTLIEMASSLGMVMRVPTHRVSMSHPTKEFGNLRIGLWLNYEMPVIGHHAIGIDRKSHTSMSQRHHSIKGFVIFLLLKQCQSRNRAIDHMEASACRAKSWASGHDKNIQNHLSSVNIELRPLFFSFFFSKCPGSAERRQHCSLGP